MGAARLREYVSGWGWTAHTGSSVDGVRLQQQLIPSHSGHLQCSIAHAVNLLSQYWEASQSGY